MANETLLVISAPGLPPYAARGLTQTWEYIDAAMVFARTINMQLITLSPPGSAKFKTTIAGKDQEPPALDGVPPGTPLTMNCTFEFGFPTGVGSAIRPVVPFSSRLSGNYTYYRPQLVVALLKPIVRFTEYQAEYDWSMDFEEI